MREYSRFIPKFWTGKTGRELRGLGADFQLLAVYLFTCPSANMIGLYYLPVQLMTYETGLPEDRCLAVLRKLCEIGFCSYDSESDVIWVHEMAAYQLGELKPKDNQLKSATNQYALAPSCMFLEAFATRYQGLIPMLKPRNNPLSTPSEGVHEPLERGRLNSTAQHSTEQAPHEHKHSTSTSTSTAQAADGVSENGVLDSQQVDWEFGKQYGRKTSQNKAVELAACAGATRKELRQAITETAATADKPCANFAVGKLAKIVADRKNGRQSQGPPHNPQVGWHPGSTHFGEGDQQL